MGRFVIRNIDDATMRELKRRAELHGRSVSDETREILEAVLNPDPERDPVVRAGAGRNAEILRGKKRRLR